jgi:hypothetical protein
VRTPTFSVEVITLPVSDVERALRFYVDQVASRLTSTIRRTTRSASSSSRRRAPAARSRSVADSPTRRSDHFEASISSSPILRPRGPACSNVGSRSVRFGTRHPLVLGTEVSHPGSTPRAGTTPASPTSLTRMATAGCYRSGATAMCDVLWKLRDVDHSRR